MNSDNNKTNTPALKEKTEHYRDYLKLYAKVILELANSPKDVQHFVDGQNLSPFEQALRNHIEQFRKE